MLDTNVVITKKMADETTAKVGFKIYSSEEMDKEVARSREINELTFTKIIKELAELERVPLTSYEVGEANNLIKDIADKVLKYMIEQGATYNDIKRIKTLPAFLDKIFDFILQRVNEDEIKIVYKSYGVNDIKDLPIGFYNTIEPIDIKETFAEFDKKALAKAKAKLGFPQRVLNYFTSFLK